MKDYIYFVDLEEYLVCNNLIKTNQIISPYIIHYKTYKTEYPIYNLDIDDLFKNLQSAEIGFNSPRFNYITLSNWHRNGLIIGFQDNKTDTILYSSPSEIERIHRIAELEIEFERVRRVIDKNLPSRLSCIFLAEDNYDGRTMLKNMFFHRTNFHIATVEIDFCLCSHNADSKWIAEYEKSKDVEAIENYWLGIEFDNSPEFEFLIEGIIKLNNEEDRKYIAENFNL